MNKNAKVYMATRSKSRADAAIKWLKQETGGKVPIFLELDLANLDSIRKAVDEFKRSVSDTVSVRGADIENITNNPLDRKDQNLHVLFNNA